MARENKKEVEQRGKARRIALAAVGALIAAGVGAHFLRHYVERDPKFVLSRDRRSDALAVSGVRYESLAKVQRIFADDAGHSVFAVPLEERRRRLLALDWVADASVSRIWPDRLAVRIAERQPVAFVQVESSVLLIDAQGMLLDLPPRAQFTFPVLSGIRAEDPPARRVEAVRALLDVEDALGPLMKQVSEVDATDPGNLRVVAQVDGRVVALILGEDNLGPRYRNFVAHYADIRKRWPQARAFDLRLDDRITAKE